MSSELKIFHSLNCSLCKAPYSKSRNGSKYPCQLWCGKAICKECWKKEKPLQKAERKHQCDFQWDCYNLFRLSSFLRGLLKHPSIIESPNGNGWLLSEPIIYPLKCPKCDVKYSIEKEESKPVILRCAHATCKKCYLTHRRADFFSGNFWMKCSICNYSLASLRSLTIERRDNWLREFLCELPELIEQIPKVKEIRIKSIADPYREKFAKMDQELEEKFRALEESLNKANG